MSSLGNSDSNSKNVYLDNWHTQGMLCNLDARIANHRKDNLIIIHDFALETVERLGAGQELDRF